LLRIVKAKKKGKAAPFKTMKVVYSPGKDLLEQFKASLYTGKRKAS